MGASSLDAAKDCFALVGFVCWPERVNPIVKLLENSTSRDQRPLAGTLRASRSGWHRTRAATQAEFAATECQSRRIVEATLHSSLPRGHTLEHSFTGPGIWASAI